MSWKLLITGTATGAPLACARSTPLVGTPTADRREGNSAPAQALVAGLGKSERTGERRGAK